MSHLCLGQDAKLCIFACLLLLSRNYQLPVVGIHVSIQTVLSTVPLPTIATMVSSRLTVLVQKMSFIILHVLHYGSTVETLETPLYFLYPWVDKCKTSASTFIC